MIELFKKADRSVNSVAREIGISQQKMDYIVNKAISLPSPEIMDKLCKILNCTIEEIVNCKRK